MARTPMAERDLDKYVPRFKEEHVSTGGRKFGIKKVPQTSMFEITGEGAGDIPAGLKGRFTSTGRAERTLKTYLNSQRLMLEALEAKQVREKIQPDTPVDILTTTGDEKRPEKVEKPSVAADKVEDGPAKDPDMEVDTNGAAKSSSKVPVTAKTST